MTPEQLTLLDHLNADRWAAAAAAAAPLSAADLVQVTEMLATPLQRFRLVMLADALRDAMPESTQTVEYFRCWPDRTWDRDFVVIPSRTRDEDIDAVVRTTVTAMFLGKDDQPTFVGRYRPTGPDPVPIVYRDDDETELTCAVCNQTFRINDDGTANHLTADDDVDYDQDAKHVPYGDPDAD